MLALVAGCDVPSALPRWETHWVVRSETTTIPVASFFSSQVTESDGEFVLGVTGGTVSEALGDLCQPCGAYNGAVVPKPAFMAMLNTDVPFPVDLDSLTLTGGSLVVRVTNHFGFDPIRPSALSGSARGQIIILISADGWTLATHVISGETTAFAPGSTLTVTIPLAAEGLPRAIGGPVQFDVEIDSPEGDPVRIDTSEFLLIEAAEASMHAASALVRVNERTVSAAPIALDLGGIDEELTRRVQRGALLLDIANPLAVAGTLTATLSTPGVTLVRSLPIVPGASKVALEFSGAELRSLFGPAPVSLTVSGPVSAATAAPVPVLPGQALTAAGRLELYLSTNSPEDGQ